MNAIIAQGPSFVLSALGNGLWQGALLSGAAWLVLRTVRGANATTRHAVLVAALLGILVLPVVTTIAAFAGHATSAGSQALPGSNPNTHRAARVTSARSASATLSAAHSLSVAHSAAHSASQAGRTEATSQTANAATASRPSGSLHVTLPAVVVVVLALFWLLCALLLAARLAVSLLYLERLKRDALPLPVDYRVRLERWDAALKGTRDVRLCRSSEVTVPIAVGIFDAMILIPDHLLEELSPEDLDRILLHELAHLRRGDDWINALERVSEALLFFNPAVRWIARQLDVEREVACDDWVLERRNEALPYAQCLVKLVERVTWPHRALVAPGVFVTRRSISIRIERLMVKQRDVRLRVSLAPLSAVAVLAIAVCFLGAYVAPSVASDTTSATPLAGTPASSLSDGERASRAATTNASSHASQRAWGAAGTTAGSGAERRQERRTNAEPARLSAQQPAGPSALQPPHPSAQQPLRSAAQEPTGPSAHQPAHLSAQLPLASSGAKAATRTGVLSSRSTSSRVATETSSRTSSNGDDAPADVSAALGSTSTSARVAVNSGDYISEMAGAGYPNLSVDDLIRLKSVGVTADFVREMEGLGFSHPSVEDLIRMRALGLTANYARDIRKVFPAVSLDTILEMRAVGVTPQYVQDLRAAGVRELTADSVRNMRAVGVDGAYIKDMAAAGYGHLSTEQLTQLRAVGVDRAFLVTVQAHGFHNLTIDQLVRLRTSGVLSND